MHRKKDISRKMNDDIYLLNSSEWLSFKVDSALEVSNETKLGCLQPLDIILITFGFVVTPKHYFGHFQCIHVLSKCVHL